MLCEGESGGSLEGGFIEHHDLCFFVVNAYLTILYPALEGIYHGLELYRGSRYK